jgi:type III pantothenate kinase
VLIAIDVGNTQTHLGMFRGEELAEHFRFATSRTTTSDELAIRIAALLRLRGMTMDEVDGAVVGSVVPQQDQEWTSLNERYLHGRLLMVTPGIKLGMSIRTDNPREVGADRVVNTLAAFTLYGGPAIVVDFGTSTNFDVVSASGEFLGGVIAPGLQISAAALFGRTARLTRVDLQAPKSPIGRSTVEAIQSGLIYGTAGEVDAIVERVREELDAPDTTVIATGGLAPVVIPHCRNVDHYAPWLTLHGLRLVYEKNVDA